MPKIIIEVGKGQNADQILASLKAQLGSVADSASILGDNTRRLEREQRQAERSFRATAAALDPAIAKSQEYSKSQAALTEALKRNIISQQEHDRLLALAKERHDDAGSSVTGLIGRYASGATAIAAFTAALAGSLAVLDQVQQFISSSISAAAESERVQTQIAARIVSTGGAAELSARQLAEMANELQNLSKFDDESLAGAQNVLLTFTSISGDTFREALSAVTDMSTALGTDLATNARLVGKALENPVKGLSALAKAGVVFTAGQREVIESLVESGDLLGAQDKILEALSERYGGAAAADVATFGGSIDRVNNLWDNFQEKVGEGVLPILSSFLSSVGNIIAGNDELAETLGVLVTEAGRVAMVFISAGADGARAFLEMASVIMGALASIAEGAADAAEFLHLDALADGLREAADGQRQNQEIAEALAKASGQVSDAAFLAAINLGKEGEAAKIGAGHSRDHALADEEAAKEAEAFAKSLRGLLDDLDPIGKAEREAAEGIAILNRALAEGMPVADYQAAIGQLIQKLNDARAAALGLTDTVKIELLELPDRLASVADIPAIKIPATLTLEGGDTEFDRESEAAAERFSQNMEAGLVSAGETFLTELMQGGDDAWEHLGENLTQVLVQSVAEWLVAQLAAIAKAAAAAAAVKLGTGSSSSGGGGWMSSLGSMFGGGGGGGGGMSSAAVGVGIYAAVVVAAIAIMKHQMDRSDAVRYNTSAGYNTSTTGAAFSSYGGKLQETGAKIAEAFEMIANEVMSATGALIDGAHRAGIAIRNDKKEFQAIVDGVLVGTFKTAEEAMVAAMKTLFQSGNLQRALDPIVQQVIDNFDSSRGPDAFVAAIKEVTAIMNESSGLTELEVTLRNLPSAATALSAKLVDMGVSIGDATAVAARWTEQQFASIRDQITGHQQTAAEQRAEKERQAAYFNAQLALARANMALMKMDIEAKVAHLQAGWNIVDGKMEIDAAWLAQQRHMLETESSIVITRDEIQRASIEAQLAALDIQLEAVNAAMVALDAIKPIDFREINIGNIGGGGHGGGNIDPGPSEAEQRAESLDAFLRDKFLASLTSLQRRLEEINQAYEEQALAASEVAGGEAALAAARETELIQLRGEMIDSLGLPLEALRDRFATLRETLAFLRDEVERTGQGGGRLAQVLSEFGDMMRSELLGLAAYFTDAIGDTEASADLRRQLAEFEWDLKRAEFRLMIQQMALIGAITPDEAFSWLRFLAHLPDNLPAAIPDASPPQQGGGYNNHDDEQLQAQRDLISALEDLADLQRDLWASNLSPLNAEEQTQFLAGQLQDAYNQAQASGSAEDVRAFQDLVRQYLSSYQDAYGSTGGYTEEFLRINSLINSLLAMGGIGGVVPGPGMLGGNAGTGTGGWRPTPGATGSVLPFERTGGPNSPLVVESPALSALASLTRETNNRLAALERRLGMLHDVTARGNEQAASRAFMQGTSRSPVGITGKPRTSSRGA